MCDIQWRKLYVARQRKQDKFHSSITFLIKQVLPISFRSVYLRVICPRNFISNALKYKR